MSDDIRIHVDVHHATLTRVRDLFSITEYPSRSDDERTVTARVGEVTLYFDNAVAAHDFATELQSAVEAIWAAREEIRAQAPKN